MATYAGKTIVIQLTICPYSKKNPVRLNQRDLSRWTQESLNKTPGKVVTTSDEDRTRVNCYGFHVAVVYENFTRWTRTTEEKEERSSGAFIIFQCIRREQRILQRFKYGSPEMKESLGICFQENGASNIYRSHKFPSNRHRTVGILSSVRGSMRTMLRVITPPRRQPGTASKKDTIRECRRVIVSSNNEHPSRPVDRM